MKIVVDTNILFSALLNSNGTISGLLFNSARQFEFYSCTYMRAEIERHWPKLLKLSKLTEAELAATYKLLLRRINFIHEGLIPATMWVAAAELVREIDPDDADFVALATYLRGGIWTGDKPLRNGLRQRNFEAVYTTSEMLALRAWRT